MELATWRRCGCRVSRSHAAETRAAAERRKKWGDDYYRALRHDEPLRSPFEALAPAFQRTRIGIDTRRAPPEDHTVKRSSPAMATVGVSSKSYVSPFPICWTAGRTVA